MFFDNLSTIMMKQNLTEYIAHTINQMKKNPKFKPQARIVQVLGFDQVSDGITNFQCIFKKQSKRGSYLRLTSWQLDLSNYQFIIYDYQYLGGEGYSVKSGKLCDTQKLKYIHNSKIITSDFVVLHTPQPKIEHVKLYELPDDLKTTNRVLKTKKLKYTQLNQPLNN